MGPGADLIFDAVVLGGLAAWVAWGWLRWRRSQPQDVSVGVICSVVGFSFGSLSALVQIASGIYAQFIGGFPFMDPTLLRIYGVEMVFALLGLVMGLCGADSKSPLRWKAPALSFVLLLFVIAQAMGE